MRALELLYQFQRADKIARGYMSKPINEAIEELEEYQEEKTIYESGYVYADLVLD